MVQNGTSWDTSGPLRISLLGIDNQTKYDKDMPLHVIAYDGAGYRAELLQDQKERNPVVILVLNFGSTRWGKAKSLYDNITIPIELKPYVSNYRINVFDIAFLTDKQVSHFHSDFKIVADYFVHHRKNADYKPASPQKFKHADELLKLFSVLAGDSRFAMTLKDKKGGKPETMWEAIDRSEAKGFEKGEKKLADLITKLLAANRNDDIAKAISSIPFRNKLYKEFQIT